MRPGDCPYVITSPDPDFALDAIVQIGVRDGADAGASVQGRALTGGWKVFVHFDGSAIRAGLGDHDPIEGRCPTSSWRVGDYLVDYFTANLDAPPSAHGNYDVWIGLYRSSAPKSENLSVSDAPPDQRDTMNRVKIATIQLD